MSYKIQESCLRLGLAKLGRCCLSCRNAIWQVRGRVDCVALMSGIGSFALLLWATIWPPSQELSKQVLLVLSVVCFVFGSYRIWAKENQRWRDLTEKTSVEAVDDLISEFQRLEDWYAIVLWDLGRLISSVFQNRQTTWSESPQTIQD
jgi:hypothetical protein